LEERTEFDVILLDLKFDPMIEILVDNAPGRNLCLSSLELVEHPVSASYKAVPAQQESIISCLFLFKWLQLYLNIQFCDRICSLQRSSTSTQATCGDSFHSFHTPCLEVCILPSSATPSSSGLISSTLYLVRRQILHLCGASLYFVPYPNSDLSSNKGLYSSSRYIK
jgi:hypothetical protein